MFLFRRKRAVDKQGVGEEGEGGGGDATQNPLHALVQDSQDTLFGKPCTLFGKSSHVYVFRSKLPSFWNPEFGKMSKNLEASAQTLFRGDFSPSFPSFQTWISLRVATNFRPVGSPIPKL